VSGTPSTQPSDSNARTSRTYSRLSGKSSLFRRSKEKKARKGGKVKTQTPLSPAERDLRLLSTKAAQSFRQTKFDLWLARHHLVLPYLITIMVLSFSIPCVVLYFEEMDPSFAMYGRYVWRVTTGLTILITLPMWIAMMQWRPATPLNGDPEPGEHMPTVDVAICCYKEDVGEVVDTIVACQRVEYPAGLLHIYLLDDGRRQELDDACEELHRSGLLRHPLTYVNRPNNQGKKAGNINHWLEKYEHECGEFFIILDADMQPFPDMLDILMGHFFGLTKAEQERCAYVQAPQWYRNYNGKAAWADIFNISEFFFYRVLQPANSTWGCTVYVGCCALWSRRAIESVNGFIGGYATEDSVTGCQVNRTLVPGTNYTWISKYVMQPVAAGVSPETLPALLEQRLRWYIGLCQMFAHHRGYFFATGLNPMQRLLYWVTSASYMANITNYLMVFVGTLILFASIFYYAHLGVLGNLAQWAFWGGPAALGGTLFIWMFIPGCSFVQFFHTMATVFLYTPVYVAAVLRHYFNVNIKVQTTAAEAEGGIRRWHPFFIMPLSAIGCVLVGAGLALWQIIISPGTKPITPILQLPLWIAFWLYVHYHVLVSIMGFSYSEIQFYTDEATGALSDPTVKAHLKRHVAQIDPSEWSSGEDSETASTYSDMDEDAALSRAAALGLSPEDKKRVLANLNFFLARRRAITETIIAETFAMGDNQTFSGQNGLAMERDTNDDSISASEASSSQPSYATGSTSTNGSVAFERKLLAAVQAESGGARFNVRGTASVY
jgi:cellulose synthase/poly-beta-1,6-N-acetylglucosamine synthase-like glycosyltransferase